jgi:hypothetical protein
MERFQNIENTIEKRFEEIYESLLQNGTEKFTVLGEGVPKVDFFRWLVEKKGLLLHGSNNQEIIELEPRQANCTSKAFGNLSAVYAVTDPVLPIFYAIKDIEKFRGTAKSGYSETEGDILSKRQYKFAISKDLLEKEPWSNGAVYIVSKHLFTQGHDDEGRLIDEWACAVPVEPIGKIEVSVNDFPYFDEIKGLED